VVLSLGECTRFDGRIAVARAAAGDEPFGRAWADGEGLSIDAVLRRALARPLHDVRAGMTMRRAVAVGDAVTFPRSRQPARSSCTYFRFA